MGLLNGENKGAAHGGRESTHKTPCRHSNNPFGHSRECTCGWWARELASQTVPYIHPDEWVGVPEPDYPESPHGPL